jgi:putative DNA primase/helicase
MNAAADPFAGLNPELESELMGELEQPPVASVDQLLKSCGVSALVDGCSIDVIVSVLRALAERLQDEDALLRAAAREAIIGKLKSIGTGSPAALADAALGPPESQGGTPDGMSFIELMPWPKPVNGAELLENIASVFCRYVVISSKDVTALVLWSVLTYISDLVYILALLVITSPEKRCGKTLVLELLQATTLRPLPASNISAASLYRVVEKYRPTLLIDEADTFLGKNDELRGVINSGHRRSSAFVLRCDGDDKEPKSFSTWCPKAIALIGKLADTLEDRSIQIRMKRKTADDNVQRLRSDLVIKETEPLKRQIIRWTRDNANEIKNSEPSIPGSLHDRAADNWRPLLAIADVAGGTWPDLAREAAETLSSSGDGDTSNRVQLLHDIRNIFVTRSALRIPSEDLAKALAEMVERPWPEWSKGKPITQRQIAKMLKPFGIEPRVIRVGNETPRGYQLDDLQDALSRYTALPNATMQQLNNDAGPGDLSMCNTDEDVADGKTHETQY